MGHTPALRAFPAFAAPFLIASLFLLTPSAASPALLGPPAPVPGIAGIFWVPSWGCSQGSGTVLDPAEDPLEALGLGSSCWRAIGGSGLGSNSVHPSPEAGLERGCTGLEMDKAGNGMYYPGNGLYWAMLGCASWK